MNRCVSGNFGIWDFRVYAKPKTLNSPELLHLRLWIKPEARAFRGGFAVHGSVVILKEQCHQLCRFPQVPIKKQQHGHCIQDC